jgi:pyruvate/2-oxoacid:ferredoxin oxidoreductase alpha subunit
LAEAAIRAGVDGYFGYPITPQTEIIEYLIFLEEILFGLPIVYG